MKILLDMNISPEWVPHFQAAGYECCHWSQKGAITAEDKEIMYWASENNYIILTHDLDFTAILATTNASRPSVIQIRMHVWLPESPESNRIIDYIGMYSKELDEGALITVDTRRQRVRILPLK